jgi:hypothetical protein
MTAVAVLCSLLAFAAPARADKGGNGKGNGAPHGHGKGDHGNNGNHGGGGHGGPRFADDQRAAMERWYHDDYARSGNCPQGLAKKGNGCQPPGQAKKRWDVGAPLPPDLALMPLPPDLRRVLPPPMTGYEYGYVEGSVVLYGVSTRIVADFFAPY